MGVGQAEMSAKELEPSEQGRVATDEAGEEAGARLCGTRQVMGMGTHFTLRKWRDMKDGKTERGEASPATEAVRGE